MQLLTDMSKLRSSAARYLILHLPMMFAFVAIALWMIAHSPFIFGSSRLALGFNMYLTVICGVYLLQLLAMIAEIRYLELRGRTKRIYAYLILLIGNSFLPVWQIGEITGLPFHGLLLTLWLFLALASFVPIFFLTFRSDRDSAFGIRMAPFTFSVLGVLTTWLGAISI